MAATVQSVPASAGASEVTAALLADGAVVVTDLLSGDVMDAIRAEVAPYVDAADPEMKHLNPAIEWFHRKARHVTGLVAKSPTFATSVLLHPIYLGVCDAILGPSCARYQLNLAHLLERLPGAEDQFLHRDEDVWNLVPRPRPELQVASVIALCDFTAANGATRVVPGSHLAGSEASDIAVAEMPTGAAVLYLGSTLHGGGANTTASGRPGVHLSYCLGWLRTEENNYLAVPPDVARTLPRLAQEIVGYAVHDAIDTGGGYLGMLDLRDPVELL